MEPISMTSERAHRTGRPGRTMERALWAMGAGALATALAAAPSPAAACGGLFCNNNQPVNQTAERIIFVDNGDDTTTAVIEIQYQGPSERFAWVLPVPEIENPDEDIRVSSELALDRLQQATNPQYSLTVRFEGDCAFPPTTSLASPTMASDMSPADGEAGVVVEASGSVGPFDWQLIEVDPMLEDAAMTAVMWLEENGYDVSGIGADLLRPYLAAENKLLAVRLTKGNDAGSIRPLMITYAGSKPSIPIRPTAVAAEEDMGVMVWVGGGSRAIPKNYNLLELNEALIDWFQPMRNYNDVVSAAADEAGGHGFVTEYADQASMLDDVIAPQWERDAWGSFSAQTFGSAVDMYNSANQQYGGWDGFRDAFATSVTIPQGADFDLDDVIGCPNCYLGEPNADEEPLATLDRTRFLRQLFELVVRPMQETDTLLASQTWVTRFYTTMSPDEMNEDPVFDFNPDLPAVSNLHTRERVVSCEDGGGINGPWEVAFEAGVVAGEGTTWPMDLDNTTMPAALRIFQVGTSGPPTLMVDNTDDVRDGMAAGPVTTPDPTTPPDADAGTNANQGPSAGVGGSEPTDDPAGAPDTTDADGTASDTSGEADSGGMFCSITAPGLGTHGRPAAALGLLMALSLLRVRRRR